MKFCEKCGSPLKDNAKFCSKCGEKVPVEDNQRKFVYEGIIHKCPNCGEIINSFELYCPLCGYEIRDSNASRAIRDFWDKLKDANDENEKITIIRNFPVPNNKEDIYEFMILASSNVDDSLTEELCAAWKTKVEQLLEKAILSFKNDDDLSNIRKMAKSVLSKVRKNKTNLKVKSFFDEISTFIPGILTMFLWLLSIFILIPLCADNLVSFDSLAYFLLLIIIFCIGVKYIPITFQNHIIIGFMSNFGLLTSIIVIFYFFEKDPDNGLLYLILFFVDIICSFKILKKRIKAQSNLNDCDNQNHAYSVVFSLICTIILLMALSISNFMVNRHELAYLKKEELKQEEKRKNMKTEEQKIKEGTYSYSVKNYIGKNVASIGKYDSYYETIFDKCGNADIKINFISLDGSYIKADNDNQKKKYVVIDQDIKGGTDLKVVYNLDYDGNPNANDIVYQSYDEINLYVSKKKDDEYNKNINIIKARNDKHIFYVRNYVDRNLASVGRYDSFYETLFDEYGKGKINLSVITQDGSYIDVTDKRTIGKYVVVSQDVKPNTELIYEFEKDSNGNERDWLFSKNIEEINLVVKKIK